MTKSRYLTTVTDRLERLLVFKQVFNEYISTCENINCGRCLASENFPTLRDYFLRNMLRLQPFLNEFRSIQAPGRYSRLHQDLLMFIDNYAEAISHLVNAIETDSLDELRFQAAKQAQSEALEKIDSIFIDRIRIENGVLCG